MKKFKIAIVGATGAVGREMLRCVFQFNFPFESIKLLASARSAGKEIEFEGHKFVVEELTENSFEGVEVAFWSAGGSISEKYEICQKLDVSILIILHILEWILMFL